MPACESKFVSKSSRKATVAKTVFVGSQWWSTSFCKDPPCPVKVSSKQ